MNTCCIVPLRMTLLTSIVSGIFFCIRKCPSSFVWLSLYSFGRKVPKHISHHFRDRSWFNRSSDVVPPWLNALRSYLRRDGFYSSDTRCGTATNKQKESSWKITSNSTLRCVTLHLHDVLHDITALGTRRFVGRSRVCKQRRSTYRTDTKIETSGGLSIVLGNLWIVLPAIPLQVSWSVLTTLQLSLHSCVFRNRQFSSNECAGNVSGRIQSDSIILADF